MGAIRMKKLTAMLLSCFCFVSTNNGYAAEGAEAGAVQVTIDASAKHQTIDNFGASDAWSMDPLGKYWTEENKARVADLLFSREKGIGLSAWRFNIGAGSAETDQAIISNPWRRAEAFKQTEDGTYDWSKQAGQQWFLRAAKERGVDTLIAFANSPPVWMTKNGHAQPDPSVGSTNLKAGYEDEFAAYLADVLEHFRQEGLEFQYISPINEPTWDWNYAGQEGNRYNNDDMKRVLLELHRELKARGLASQISAPDGVEITALLDDEFYKAFTNNERYMGGANQLGLGKYREYIKDLLGDPELREAVGNKIASHSYWSDYSRPGDDRLGKLRELLVDNLRKYSADAKYWMTEYCILGSYGPGRDLGIDPALHVARTIHFDLTKANASAWQWWTAVSKEDYKDGLIYTDFNNPGDEQNILTSKILWALGNYSKFIRPGAERIALTGLDEESRGGLLGSAYLHEGEKTATAVFVNDSGEDRRVRLNLTGLDPKETVFVMKSYVTSAGQDLARGADVPAHADGTFETVIPARSVVTLYGDIVKDRQKPEAPDILEVKPLNKGLYVAFSSPAGASAYEIRYGAQNDIAERTIALEAGESAVIRGLENGETYFVTVRGGNRNGFGPPSKRAYGTPQLLAPSGVAASGSDGAFTVSYDVEAGIPAYRVRYGTQPGVYAQEVVSDAPDGSVEVAGLANGTTYYGVVEAVDGPNVGPASAEFAVTPDAAAPGKVVAVPGDGKAQLEWSAVEGATGYIVQAIVDSQTAAAVPTDRPSAEVTGLPNGTPAAVRVFTVGQGGQGTGFAETVVTPSTEYVRVEDPFDDGDLSRYRQELSAWVMEDGWLKHVSGGDHQGEIGFQGVKLIDGTITAVAKHATPGADWGIAFRGTSYSKGYMFGFENGILFLRRDGQSLAPAVPFTAKLGELYKLEVRLEGKRIRASIDGQPVFDVADTMYTSGRVGLHSWADAQFAYVKAANAERDFEAKPEIYQVKEGDRQVSLQYSEVDGADAYVIRYKPVTAEDDAYAETTANPGATTVAGLTNGVTYVFTVVAKRGAAEAASEPAEATPNGSGSSILYYVDAGDDTPAAAEQGETFGSLQTLEEQPYGSDPVTGMKWGYEADDGLTWARTGSADPYDSIRQYDGNTNGKGLAYRFEIPNGTYKVTVGFYDPWSARDRTMQLVINGETKQTNYVIGSNREEKSFGGIAATGGELVVKVVKAGGSKPMLSWIKVEADVPVPSPDM
ncbi:glycoside hydrolase [Paenibacillus sp.]|uniref:glycoside hydrolase n=1 Tax=Paenibacillus sp. TaxID=58172 RepID=UPI002D3BC7DA|nr:glycoside hydrolase [Paenibacillus sp.]HZG85974.1 glycoside hydrolase [Paenibacillus sp.]